MICPLRKKKIAEKKPFRQYLYRSITKFTEKEKEEKKLASIFLFYSSLGSLTSFSFYNDLL